MKRVCHTFNGNMFDDSTEFFAWSVNMNRTAKLLSLKIKKFL